MGVEKTRGWVDAVLWLNLCRLSSSVDNDRDHHCSKPFKFHFRQVVRSQHFCSSVCLSLFLSASLSPAVISFIKVNLACAVTSRQSIVTLVSLELEALIKPKAVNPEDHRQSFYRLFLHHTIQVTIFLAMFPTSSKCPHCPVPNRCSIF